MNDSTQSGSWWNRLSGGLKRTSSSLGGAIASLAKRRLDDAALEDLEHELIRADLGPEFARRIADVFSEARFREDATIEEVKTALAGEIEKVLE
ncbi:MAG: signal recognition particle receptor subunit alpha, partial [Pseudolabrys sp.]